MSWLAGIALWVLSGLVVGLTARLLVRGQQQLGWLAILGLGVLGSLAGGCITFLVEGGQQITPSSFLMSAVGAMVVLVAIVSWETRADA